MKEELLRFLSEFPELTREDMALLVEHMVVEEVPKNTVLVRPEDPAGGCFFVLKGCLRQYVLADGTEKTIAFYTERYSVNYFSQIVSSDFADHYLVAMEDSLLISGTMKADEALFEQIPVLKDITRRLVEEDFGKTRLAFAKFMISTPEERYLQLLEERPGLLQRVPQAYIASFLGITPESLSRIRRRIRELKS